MKYTPAVLPHRGPVDTYCGGVTCLDMGEGGRTAEWQKKNQADSSEAEIQLIKSVIGHVVEWQEKGKEVTDMNRQLYFIWTDNDGLIWKHCEAALPSALFFQTHNADLHSSALTPIVEQRNRTRREPGFLIVSDKMGSSKEWFLCNPLGILQNFTGASWNIFPRSGSKRRWQTERLWVDFQHVQDFYIWYS